MNASLQWGTRTASAVAIGTAKLERPDRGYEPVEIALPDGQQLTVVEDHRSLTDWRTKRHLDNHEEVMAALVTYLRECGGEEFRSVVQTALSDASACSVWNRILGVGAERVDIAGDLLWPVASSLPLIELRDLSRDAIIFLAAAYPMRPESERSAFETALVEWLEGEADGEERRVSLAARILSSVPDEAIATASGREVKARLGSEGRLVGNPPYMSFKIGFGENDDIVDSLLQDGGQISRRVSTRRYEIRRVSLRRPFLVMVRKTKP